MPNSTQPSTGNTFGFSMESAASDFLDAKEIATQAGSKNFLAAARSKAFNVRRGGPTKDTTPKAGIIGSSTLRGLDAPVPIVSTKPGEQQDLSGINDPVANARLDILKGFQEQYARAGELEAADTNIIRNKIIADMDPYTDIDTRIKEVTRQGLVSKTLLNQKLRSLPPSQRRAVVARRLQMFGDTVDNLLEIRSKRKLKIEGRVSEEIGDIRAKETAFTNRVSMLTNLGNMLDGIGADRETKAMMNLTVEKAKEELARLRRKADAKGIASSTKEQLDAAVDIARSSKIPVETILGSLPDKDKAEFWLRMQTRPNITNRNALEDPNLRQSRGDIDPIYGDPYAGLQSAKQFYPPYDDGGGIPQQVPPTKFNSDDDE